MPRKLPSAERIKQLLTYDPLTGEFYWNEARGSVATGKVAGSPHSAGYSTIRIDGQLFLSHRLAWKYVYGVDPPVHIDHKNRNRLDNRIDNLREATSQQNLANASGHRNSVSGRKGVTYHRQRKKYWARIMVNGKTKSLGLHNTIEEAGAAYDAAAVRMNGAFAITNTP